jgi:hypothetical protein
MRIVAIKTRNPTPLDCPRVSARHIVAAIVVSRVAQQTDRLQSVHSDKTQTSRKTPGAQHPQATEKRTVFRSQDIRDRTVKITIFNFNEPIIAVLLPDSRATVFCKSDREILIINSIDNSEY